MTAGESCLPQSLNALVGYPSGRHGCAVGGASRSIEAESEGTPHSAGPARPAPGPHHTHSTASEEAEAGKGGPRDTSARARSGRPGQLPVRGGLQGAVGITPESAAGCPEGSWTYCRAWTSSRSSPGM
ncbi:hypothetical protein GCM10010340_44530 [Streptomyces griseoloalbus]|nr:hypothetical protein GCM10010340_44530 [Streptomyces albaduncus]